MDRIKEKINEYIEKENTQYAIMIDGEWGSGKTFFIKNEYIKKEEKMIYVSLYGVKNIETIDEKIYYELLQKTGAVAKIMDKLSNIYNGLKKTAGSVLNIDLPQISKKNISSVINLFTDIKDYIVVFDDLERCELPINESLGYINNMVEHRNVKCIIVANEKEIEKTNYSNYELKILSCLSENVDYDDEDKQDNYGINSNKSQKNINLDLLRKRVNNLYDYNNKYKIIKEKLVETTIEYIPDLKEMYNCFIEKYKEDNKELYELFDLYKGDVVDIMIDNNCYNLRTMQFIINSFEKIYKESKIIIEEKYEERKNILFEKMLRNTVFVCIGFKNGININKILNGCMCSNNCNLSGEKTYLIKDLFTAFNFINDFIMTSYINRCEIEKTLEYYLQINYDLLDENDPFKKLEVYWELEDEEIKLALNGILDKMRNNLYNYKLFPKILEQISALENMNFEIEKIDEIIECMKDNIKKQKVKYLDFHTFSENKKTIEIYNNHVKELQAEINKDKIYTNNEIINDIMKKENWGIELYNYITDNNSQYTFSGSFLTNIKIEELFKKINSSNAKNIYHFKYILDRVYRHDSVEKDYDRLFELYLLLGENSSANGFGVSKRSSLECLMEKIKKLIERIIKVDKKIIVNKAECKKCGDVIESKTVNDFKRCSCGSIAVDGGLEYLKRIGNEENIIELSEFYDENNNKSLKKN